MVNHDFNDNFEMDGKDSLGNGRYVFAFEGTHDPTLCKLGAII
jgi:hypothetical protein